MKIIDHTKKSVDAGQQMIRHRDCKEGSPHLMCCSDLGCSMDSTDDGYSF